nr:aspartate dehydrogenase [Acuticoccus mangrovi]
MIIGRGPIARYVAARLGERAETSVAAFLVRPGTAGEAASLALGDVAPVVESREAVDGVDVVADCAGGAGLVAHGAGCLARGDVVVTLSAAALADPLLEARLREAAAAGGGRLRIAAGAIGAVDALAAAAVGGLDMVRYTGVKPPAGWRGSPAESVLDLDRLAGPAVHFEGSAREAARRYPKNANVAATIALAGVGFEATAVRLVADPAATANTHRLEAEGAFGRLDACFAARPLPDNPRSSALAAMSMVRALTDRTAAIRVV